MIMLKAETSAWPTWLHQARRSPLTLVLFVWGVLFVLLGLCLAWLS